MSIYAVGDIQGCYTPLASLLESVNFNPECDQLWCAGDVINRGPKSLKTLRYLYSIKDICTIVLGNHDLHLLGIAYGNAKIKRSDTVQEILDAPDSEELLQWLRHQPLIHHAHDFTMVHAGIPPQWSINYALKRAKEVEKVLQGDSYREYFLHMYGNQPDQWDKNITGYDRLRLITNYLTRMRFCDTNGRLDLDNKLGAETASKNMFPWFEIPDRKAANDKIIFGHWASLEGKCNTANVYPLDTGCVWGGKLTMMRLEDCAMFSHK